jgi:hypothetical protein
MFLAYDKIPHGQHALYQEYALLTPGAETRLLARDIAGHAYLDPEVKELLAEIRSILVADPITGYEWTAIAIRNATAEAWDVYLMDEDSLFEGLVVNVAREDVIATVKDMLATNPRLASARMWIARRALLEAKTQAETEAKVLAGKNASKKKKLK